MGFAKGLLNKEMDIRLLNFVSVLVLSVLAYGFNNLYAAFFVPFSMGIALLLLLNIGLDALLIMSIGPSLGYALLIIFSYIDSILRIGINGTALIFGVIGIIISSLSVTRIEDTPQEVSVRKLLMIFIPVVTVIATRAFAYTYPTDNVDNLFHATKIHYILTYNSMYPSVVPVFNIFTYPGGYHAVVSYLVSVTGAKIPVAMRVFRILAWSLFMLGVYSFSRIWFNETVANFSLLAVLVTNMGYYYLLVYIEPNFFGFYFFLTLLAVAYLYLTSPKYRTLKTYAVSTSIGTATIFVHPYTFQNFVLVIGLFVIFNSIKHLRLFPSAKVFFKLVLFFGILPFVIYASLNPFFMFPRLAHVKIEYPWASTASVVMENLAVMVQRLPHDNWNFFHLLLNWTFIRNENYLATLFMLLSFVSVIQKRKHIPEYFSLLGFYIFVLVLIINRLTINVAVPLYGSAAIERMYLWTLPLLPVFTAIGMASLYEFKSFVNSPHIRILYAMIIIAFFLLPTWGIARDLLSAEANFYVTPDVLDDFNWIGSHVSGGYILNSCYADSTPWLPFFQGNKYTVMFDSYISKCRFHNVTFKQMLAYLLTTNSTLPDTIAYIDTNAPSINPLLFLNRYELIRLNGNNWMFNVSSRNVSHNMELVLKTFRLCSSLLPGNTFVYGKYYVWGFKKKYFYVEYFAFDNKYYAWLMGNEGIIAFNPCNTYNRIKLAVYSTTETMVNITINGKDVLKNYNLPAGPSTIVLRGVNIKPAALNTIEISKKKGTLLIKYLKFEEDANGR